MQVEQTLGNLEEADGHTYSGIELKICNKTLHKMAMATPACNFAPMHSVR